MLLLDSQVFTKSYKIIFAPKKLFGLIADVGLNPSVYWPWR